jgi:hypothetical protein
LGKSQPKAPDPAKTAAAQGQWNSFTAQQQQAMNMTNQNSPWGSLTYNQTGTQTIIDPNGKPVQVPRYTANTTLSPQQQAIYNQTQKTDLNLANIATQQSGKIGNLLNDPFSFENSDAEQWAYDLASPRILKQQGQNQAALESQLVNAGIRRGTPQWDSEMSRLTNANTDQLNQLALTGRGQAFSEALAQRNQPLNEVIGLMSGTQIQNPNATFAQTPQSQVGGVDYSGLVNQKYQGEMQQYNAGMGALGGLFGGVASIFSDARLKTDIKRIGKTDEGTPIYQFRYKSGGPVQIGYMAQDLLETNPGAVSMHESGYMMVDYGKVS